MGYSLPLAQLLKVVSIDSIDDTLITDITIDSRTVKPGSLFFAYPGSTSDGRDFVEQAQAAGASALIYEADNYSLPDSISIPAFAVDQLQSAVGCMADVFFGKPSHEMQVFGVTGTNGKTTCCYLLTQALTQLGMQAAMIGTVGTGKLDALSNNSQTTPDPISVHRLLADFLATGITQVCMEVSSHALDQGRVNGVSFFCTLFTNLSHDHLDYHGDMTSYASAKQRLFSEFHSELVITNADDQLGASLLGVADTDFIVQYGRSGDVYADEVTLDSSGIRAVIEGNGVEFDIVTPLVGKVNVPNLELLVATLLALSTSIEDIQAIAKNLRPAPGRMELYTAEGQPQVVVDYAHTPDALEKALVSMQQHCEGELWCVFGCGGDRDRSKRPLMGAAAAKYANHLIITNDNPRSEHGVAIADDIQAGIQAESMVILDRAQAISHAINAANAEDWVVVAGKGHETYQQVGNDYLPFSDRQQVAAALGVAA